MEVKFDGAFIGEIAKPMSSIDVENVLNDTGNLQAKLMAFWELKFVASTQKNDDTFVLALHKRLNVAYGKCRALLGVFTA